jgi:hypothetical protein
MAQWIHLLESNVSLDLTAGESEVYDSEEDSQMNEGSPIQGNFDSLLEDSSEGKGISFLPEKRDLYLSLLAE